MIAEKVVQTSHRFRTKFNQKIELFRNMQLRVVWGNRRNAYADNMGSVFPENFSEESRIEIWAKPLRWHVPNAIRINFVAFRHGYLG